MEGNIGDVLTAISIATGSIASEGGAGDESVSSPNGSTREILQDRSTFIMNVAQFYNQSSLSDILLKVGDRVFYGHKFVLAKSSDVFRTMLYSDPWCQPDHSPSNEARLELNETAECMPVFDTFLRYLYTAEIEITCATAVGILCLADKYNVESLKRLAVDYMMRHSRSPLVHNALHWYAWAKVLNLHGLVQQCFQTINWNVESIIRSPDWYDLDPEFLADILQSSEIVVENEQALFDAVIQWLQHERHAGQVDDNAYRLLPLIRLPMMKVDQLYHLETADPLPTAGPETRDLVRRLLNNAYRFRSLCPEQHNLTVSFAEDCYQPRDYRYMNVDTVRIGNTIRFGFQVDVKMFVGPVPKEIFEGEWKLTYRKNGDVWSLQVYCHESAMVNNEAKFQVTILVHNEDNQIIHVVRAAPYVCSRGTHQNITFDITECAREARTLYIILKPLAR